MKTIKTNRGFRIVEHEKYAGKLDEETRLIQESSAIGDYEHSWDTPGSSFLWVGQDHHLNRLQVRELIDKLEYWLQEGRLKLE